MEVEESFSFDSDSMGDGGWGFFSFVLAVPVLFLLSWGGRGEITDTSATPEGVGAESVE